MIPPRRAAGGDAAGVEALSARFRTGRQSPEDACAASLARIAQCNPTLNAFVQLDADTARQAARESAARWRAGRPNSAIDGVPIGVKCNIAVRGLAWSAGTGARLSRIAERDADCVARLRAAGAVVLGTLNMDEAGLGATGDNPWLGRVGNPHRLEHRAGGSSGGAAAAVAAGLCAAALGTDTMGSVRIPAAYCGVYGLVPPAGRISTVGVVPLSPSYDRIGILARSLGDAALVLGTFPAARDGATAHAAVASAKPAAGTAALGVPATRFAAWALPKEHGCDAATRQAYAGALSRLDQAGWRIDRIALDGFSPPVALRWLLSIVETEGACEYRGELLDASSRLSPQLRKMLQWGADLDMERVAACRAALARAATQLRHEMAPYAGTLMPCVPGTAPLADREPATNPAFFTAIASIAGLPAIAVPLGTDVQGLPIGIQVLGSTEALPWELAGLVSENGAAVGTRPPLNP